MGFFDRLKLSWKRMSTAEKIGLVIDAICGSGSVLMGMTVSRKLCEDTKSVVSKVCIKTTVAGLSIAAGDISAKALRENYGNLIGEIVDRSAKKAEEEKGAESDE